MIPSMNLSLQVEMFFRKMATGLEATEDVYNQNEEPHAPRTASPENHLPEDDADLEFLQADASFSQRLSDTGLLYNRSTVMVKRSQPVLLWAWITSLSQCLTSGGMCSTNLASIRGDIRSRGVLSDCKML